MLLTVKILELVLSPQPSLTAQTYSILHRVLTIRIPILSLHSLHWKNTFQKFFVISKALELRISITNAIICGGECWMDYVKIKCIIYFINQESILSADEGSNAYTDETMNKEKFLISLLDA